MRVTLIHVSETGDRVLCLNGALIAGLDPALGDPAWVLNEAAKNLANHFNVEVEERDCSIEGFPDDWGYAEVVARVFPGSPA